MFADIWLSALLQRKGPTDAISSLYTRIWELTLIRATAVIKDFREVRAPCSAEVNLRAKLRIVITLEIIG